MKLKSWRAAAFATAAVLALTPAALALAENGAAFFPPHGLDLTAVDQSAKPGDDFFQYVNGAWLDRTPIPDDKTSVTMGRLVTERTEANLHALIEDAAKDAPMAPKDLRGKVGAFYASFMDEKGIEALGARPIAPELAAIRAANTREGIAALMGRGADDFYGTAFGFYLDADLKDPSRYAAYLGQAGLNLPDRDYYLEPDFAETRAAYQAYVAKMLTLSGWPDAEANAAKIVALETAIAKVSYTKAQQRDLPNLYHPMTEAELKAFAPGFPWSPFLKAAQLNHGVKMVVAEKDAFPRIARIYAETPVAVLQAWMAFQVADAASPYLSHAFLDARFDFRGKSLTGQPRQQERWKLGVAAVSGGDCLGASRVCWGTLNWGVGQLYTAKYFPAETKAKIVSLVADLKSAFRVRLQNLDWMGPATKQEALRKLDTYLVKVGYPDTPRDYSNVAVRRDDLVGNVRRAAAADWAFYVKRAGGPVDRTDWFMTPQTVDAYNGSLRDIVFPAAILQAPEFDPDADPAYNYGAIGAIIGHELTHGFDDQGRTIDADGALRDWWTPEDATAFKARAGMLGAQYATYEPVPGLHINPDLTMGENIADLGGLMMALDAYHASLKGQAAPVVDGMTGDQRVLAGYAQAWRGKARPEAIRQQTVSDPHSYRKFRVNGIVRNVDAWYAAFDVQPGQKLYLAPKDRVRIW